LKKFLVVISLPALIFIGYYLLSSIEDNKKKQARAKLENLNLLFRKYSSEDKSQNKKRRDISESAFWDNDGVCSGFPNGLIYTDEEELFDKASGADEIPIDPNTGNPWSIDAIQQFEEIRKVMPDNEILPHILTKEEKQKQLQQYERYSKAYNAVENKKFSREDLEIYFGHQKKIIQDRKQIIEYIFELEKKSGILYSDKDFQKILNQDKDQLKQIEFQEKELLKKLNLDDIE
jgi:hypothetical protein